MIFNRKNPKWVKISYEDFLELGQSRGRIKTLEREACAYRDRILELSPCLGLWKRIESLENALIKKDKRIAAYLKKNRKT